jgi:phage terminase large subunit-like protein
MQDPGSAGVAEAQATARALDGSNVRFATASGDKETRAKPISAQAEAGNVKLVRGLWNDEFLRELENFPQGKHDDAVDALSGAYEQIGGRGAPFEYEAIHRLGALRGIELALGACRERWPSRGLSW